MAHRASGKRRKPRHTPLTTLAILVVLGGWVANMAASIMVEGYQPDPTVSTALMAVLGFILAGKMATKQDEPDTVLAQPDETQGDAASDAQKGDTP